MTIGLLKNPTKIKLTLHWNNNEQADDDVSSIRHEYRQLSYLGITIKAVELRMALLNFSRIVWPVYYVIERYNFCGSCGGKQKVFKLQGRLC
jgi:hypothetical protein